MKAQGDGILRAAEHSTDLLVREPLPGDEQEDLAVMLAEAEQRSDHEICIGASRSEHFGIDALNGQPGEKRGESLPAHLRAVAVGEHTPCNPVQPQQNLLIGRRVRKTAPENEEGVRHDVVRLGRIRKTSGCIGEKRLVVRAIETPEPDL
jgi:hypothetical protein